MRKLAGNIGIANRGLVIEAINSSTHNMYFIRKSEQKIDWIYIADLNSKRLWTEIAYPDWGGK